METVGNAATLLHSLSRRRVGTEAVDVHSGYNKLRLHRHAIARLWEHNMDIQALSG